MTVTASRRVPPFAAHTTPATRPRSATSDPPAIEIRALRKRYPNGVEALRGIDLRIAHGEVVGYLGPNGAGKTTTMKILTGLIRPTNGSVRIDGIDVVRCPKRARRALGALIEVPGVYEYLTPVEFLTYTGRIYGLAPALLPSRIDEVLALVGLGDWPEAKIGSFSTGMTRRLILAQAILHDPNLLILDEPGLGLDPKGMVDIRRIIKRLQQLGKTIFLSSHLLNEVQATCDRIVMINAGVIALDRPVLANMAQTTDTKTQNIECRFATPLTSAQEAVLADLVGTDDTPGTGTGTGSATSATVYEYRLDEDGTRAVLILDDAGTAAAAVLARLVRADLPVAAFQPAQGSLEELYISLIGEGVHENEH